MASKSNHYEIAQPRAGVRAHAIWAGPSWLNHDPIMGGRGCQGQGLRFNTLGSPIKTKH